MQKQKLLIIVGIVVLLMVGGLAYMKFKNGNLALKGSATMDSGIIKKDIFTSVKDALSKKMTLVCEFSDDKGTFTKSYIKNGAVRVTSSEASSQSGDFILKDNKMYMWDAKTKEGFVYAVPEGDQTTEASQGDEYLNMIDTYKDSCKVAAVEDSYFTVPTNVKFQDMSKLLEDLQKQMPQIPQQ